MRCAVSDFWFRNGVDIHVEHDGRLSNVHTRSTPAFLHYNGNSKSAWTGKYSARSVERSLRLNYKRKLQTMEPEDAIDVYLDYFVRNRVAFLGATFEQDKNVTLAQICQHGTA